MGWDGFHEWIFGTSVEFWASSYSNVEGTNRQISTNTVTLCGFYFPLSPLGGVIIDLFCKFTILDIKLQHCEWHGWTDLEKCNNMAQFLFTADPARGSYSYFSSQV